MEIWKSIKNYENFYEISNYGRVKSITRCFTDSLGRKRFIKGKIMKPILINGYLKIVLYKNNKHKQFFIHRLVAEVFVPNDNKRLKTQVNHIDENKKNPYYKNLEWTTPRENTLHAYKTGLAKISNCKEHLNLALEKVKRPVLMYSLDNKFIREFKSIREAADYFNKNSATHIMNVCKGKKKTAYGYIFKYKNN